MTGLLRALSIGLCCVCIAAGCGDGGGAPDLAAVTGSVTFNGGPLAGATVSFLPEKGPLAMGVTDMNGQFKLSSGTSLGCTIGPAKVTVVAIPSGGGSSNPAPTFNPNPNMSAAEQQEAGKKMAEATQNFQSSSGTQKSKSLIPERYSDVATSGLSFTVEKDSSKNNFKIELMN
jgi:hypothetical protein